MSIVRPAFSNDTGDKVSGTLIDSAFLTALFDAIENWAVDTYVPVLTGSGGNPSLGNGSASGKYMEIGDVVFFVARWIAGSTTTFGAGNYSFSLPVTAATSWAGAYIAFASDASAGGVAFNARGILNSSTTIALILTTEAAGSSAATMTPTTPITFANGDSIQVSGFYFRS